VHKNLINKLFIHLSNWNLIIIRTTTSNLRVIAILIENDENNIWENTSINLKLNNYMNENLEVVSYLNKWKMAKKIF